MSSVVAKAGALLMSRINELSLCVTYPESAAVLGLPVLEEEKSEPVVESSPRFSTKECGHPVLSITELVFSINKPILLHGLTVYGNKEGTYRYKLCLRTNEKVLSTKEGSFDGKDCSGEHSLVQLMLKDVRELEVCTRCVGMPIIRTCFSAYACCLH